MYKKGLPKKNRNQKTKGINIVYIPYLYYMINIIYFEFNLFCKSLILSFACFNCFFNS